MSSENDDSTRGSGTAAPPPAPPTSPARKAAQGNDDPIDFESLFDSIEEDEDDSPAVAADAAPVDELAALAGAAAAPKRNVKREKQLDDDLEALQSMVTKKRKRASEVEEDDERWLVRIDGVDYGPYDAAGVRERLTTDQIDENTLVTDTESGDMRDLVDVEYFTDFVLEYIPKREMRKIEAQERREELVQEVKKRSVRATFSVAIGAVFLAATGLAILHFSNILPFRDVVEVLRPTPVEFPFEQAVRTYRFEFEVPEPEYQSIEADNSLVASLFQERSGGGSRSGGGTSSGGGGDDYLDDVPDDYVVDFDSSSPAFRLDQSQINSTLASNSGRIASCFQDELRNNPSFRGATLRFSINPDGRTFNVRASSDSSMSSSAENCLVRAVRRVRFPQFNDVPMNVSYPFYVQ